MKCSEIQSLWNFARTHPNEIADAFMNQRAIDIQHLATLSGDEHLNYMRTTLDFHRRQVSQFYGFLTAVYDEGDIERKWIYKHWDRSTLEIIPKIIIPMEKAIEESIGISVSSKTLDRLNNLHSNSPTQ